MRGHRDLRTVVWAAALCAALALVLPFGAVRLAFAAPLTLFLPGYAIGSATFARHPIGRPQLLALSVGLSLAVLTLGSLVLNYLPGGLRAGWWALLLVLVVLGACRAAALARPRAAAGPPVWPRLRVRRLEGILLAGGALAAAAALTLAMTPTSAKNAIGYTQLWMLPAGSASRPAVEVGVGNEEQATHTYTLRLRAGHQRRPFSSQELTLDPGQSHVVEVPALPVRHGGRVRIVATLFRAGLTNVYRQATVWIPGEAPR